MNATKFANTIKTFDNGEFYKCMQQAATSTYLMARLTWPFLTDEEVKELLYSLLDECVIGSVSLIPDLCSELFKSLGDEFINELIENLELTENMEV
ncbi:MAG: hypothetical protein ACLVLR_13640 [Turicibacter sanguinis]